MYEIIYQKMYGEYKCACGCGKVLNCYCIGVGDSENDENGYEWSMFAPECFARIMCTTPNPHPAYINAKYGPSPVNE